MRGRRFINLFSGGGVAVAPPVQRGIFTANPALTSTDNGNQNCNFRIRCTLSDYMGPQFRVGILPGATNVLTSSHVAAGRWDGNLDSPDATATLTEALYSGVSGFTNATAIQWSDWTDSGPMAGQPAGTDVIISYNTAGVNQASQAYAAAPINAAGYFKAGTGTWQDENVTGYTPLNFNFAVAFIETRGGSPPPTPPADYIPLTYNDPIFARNTNGTAPVTVANGTNIAYRSITEPGGAAVATYLFQGNNVGTFIAAISPETVRIGAVGDFLIQYAWFSAVGLPGDHADTIQIFSSGSRGGTVNIKNTYIKAETADATAGFFCADNWGGNINFENVVFDGGPYGLKVTADPTCRIVMRLRNVYFITGSFGTGPFVFQDGGTGTHSIEQWDNVRYATIVGGVIVPGALIPQPAFTPADLAPAFWAEPARGGLFQSNAGTTPAVANGDVVGFLSDLSGNAKNYTSEADNSTRPTLQGVGVKPCVRFDGVNDLLRRTDSLGLLAAPGYSLAFALKANSPAVDARLFAEGNSASNNTLFIPAQAANPTSTNSNVLYRNDAGTQLVSPSSMTNAGTFNGSTHVLIITDDDVTVRSYLDGVTGAFTNWTPSGVFTIDRSCIGALLRAASGNWWAGDVYGIVAVKRVLTAGERAQLTSYMAALM